MSDSLPLPFYEDPWKPERRIAAQALWHWHQALRSPLLPKAPSEADLPAFFAEQRERTTARQSLAVVPGTVATAAYEACAAFGLDRALLAEQVAASQAWVGPLRFEAAADLKAFSRAWALPHARLLAGLAGSDRNWQRPALEGLALSFFLIGALVHLPAAASRDQLLIPQEELASAGVAPQKLRTGPPDAAMQRLLWKQNIRARDALAQGVPLIHELDRRYAAGLKRAWLGGLEVLNLIERRGYDVWSAPVALSRWHYAQIRFQARFGRTSFRKS